MENEKTQPFSAEIGSVAPVKSLINIKEARINEFEGRVFPQGVREHLLNRFNEMCLQVETRLNISDDQTLEFEVVLVGPGSIEKLKEKLKHSILSKKMYILMAHRAKN